MKITVVDVKRLAERMREVKARADAMAQQLRERYGDDKGNLIVAIANMAHYWETVLPMLPPKHAEALTQGWSTQLSGAACVAATIIGITDKEFTTAMREMWKVSVVELDDLVDAGAVKPTFSPENES